MPFLIQRVIRRDRKNPEPYGVDAYFSFDYMGASEFEFGTLPKALKKMKAKRGSFSIQRVKVELNGQFHTGWAVCRPEEFDEVVATFADQLGPRIFRKDTLERTEMDRAYGLNSIWKDKPGEITGWWALDAAVPWLLFVKKADARLWLKTLKGYPK